MKHLDLWWDLPVDIDFYFFEVEGISRLLTEARFQIEQNLQREPYADVQHQSRRCYIEAKKPGDMS
ncbi:MAG TPA: hypothetical protein VMD30_10910 [Tepidisphaeraceae bacterium]|nr:hypothetical protein [Tepidisphaeraceae bacterium]